MVRAGMVTEETNRSGCRLGARIWMWLWIGVPLAASAAQALGLRFCQGQH